MTMHTLSESGRFTALWDDEAEGVVFHWKGKFLFAGTVEPDAGTISDMLDDCHQIDKKPPRAREIRAMIEASASLETWLEHCPHDLHHYGQVGITC